MALEIARRAELQDDRLCQGDRVVNIDQRRHQAVDENFRRAMGQRVATTGVPVAKASTSALGLPSKRDDKTKQSAAATSAKGSAVYPGRSTRSARPNARA